MLRQAEIRRILTCLRAMPCEQALPRRVALRRGAMRPGCPPLVCPDSPILFPNMPNKTESILLVGVIAGLASVLASFIPAAGDFMGCLVALGAGMLVVWHYTDKHRVTLTSGGGINLGVLTGLAAFGTGFVLDTIVRLIGVKPSLQEEIRQGVEQGGANMSQLGAFGEFMMSPAYVVFVAGIGLVVSVLLGLVGGLIGSKMFKRGEGEGPVDEPADLV